MSKHPALAAPNIASRAICCDDPDERAALYKLAAEEHGSGFADHLRDVVEAHHLIVANERSIALGRAVSSSARDTQEKT